ncbi:MAG: hypothetical protein F6J93_34330 [Oscillatoria sp. SIO1A7]|nr:hypothetical protein [Oscillatoria sp. SIO1A7]
MPYIKRYGMATDATGVAEPVAQTAYLVADGATSYTLAGSTRQCVVEVSGIAQSNYLKGDAIGTSFSFDASRGTEMGGTLMSAMLQVYPKLPDSASPSLAVKLYNKSIIVADGQPPNLSFTDDGSKASGEIHFSPWHDSDGDYIQYFLSNFALNFNAIDMKLYGFVKIFENFDFVTAPSIRLFFGVSLD